ncbi:response regulator transcription factor [Hydrogenothermus marinus]|uniref:Two-component system copper resistance phosphate regulon response regulator CusR n=1 Tax=Hydrogenothermus marinus TaxID=133270 RepID=A0A3M0B7F1_9AQUI|nr:response regulator transcription factor [Hydrogenothermus marinus]RMA93071.1 two-component system copper resistance phosphate regulon response regulator CusR [Hydrogenothermus marinus]
MKILIVEDNKDLNETIKEILEINGFLSDSAYDGEEALDFIQNFDYDLIILDIMLPKIDGFQVCKEIRDKGIDTPVLMLTAKDTTKDKVKGLDIGADDYLVKPFEIEELIARIKALIRRTSSQKKDIIKISNYIFDLKNRKVFKDNQEIQLTPKLFCILEQLLRNRGNIVSYESLMNKCWDINDYPTKETVRANIKLLRKTLNDKDLIKNITGVGYKIE